MRVKINLPMSSRMASARPSTVGVMLAILSLKRPGMARGWTSLACSRIPSMDSWMMQNLSSSSVPGR